MFLYLDILKDHAAEMSKVYQGDSSDVSTDDESEEEKEKVFEVLMRIDTVHGYGPSTPPLAVGSEITLLEENNSDRVFGKILKDKSEIELKLKIRTLPSRTTEERVWKVIIIYK